MSETTAQAVARRESTMPSRLLAKSLEPKPKKPRKPKA